jgi:hypothetical protein
MKMAGYGTGTEYYAVAGFGVRGVEPLGTATVQFSRLVYGLDDRGV